MGVESSMNVWLTCDGTGCKAQLSDDYEDDYDLCEDAREIGWVEDRDLSEWFCPDCAKTRAEGA